MPGFPIRQVDFNPNLAYSRPPRDDEVYVMKAFDRHASHCTQCARPYEVHRLGQTLCSKGLQRARDVAQYLYNKGGQAYSLVDREGNQRIRVEIPAGCESVRGLLKAMERGLRLHQRAPVVSYDPTYHITPRIIQTEPRTHELPEVRKPRLETAGPSPCVYTRQIRRDKPYHVGRGSLWEQDMKERENQRNSTQPVYYIATPRVPSPVPPKNSRWHWKPVVQSGEHLKILFGWPILGSIPSTIRGLERRSNNY